MIFRGFRRDNPGEIRSIEEHPSEPDKVRVCLAHCDNYINLSVSTFQKILIAYSLGLCIVWNLKSKEVEYRHQHMVC